MRVPLKCLCNQFLKHKSKEGTVAKTVQTLSVRRASFSVTKEQHKKTKKRVPLGHWKDTNAQRSELEKLGKELGVKELNDWYSVNPSEVKKKLSFVKNRHGSLFNALKTLYPHHEWDPLKISSKVPRGYWDNEDAQRDALESVGKQLGVKELDDWYSVDANFVTKQLSFIYRVYNGSLRNTLKHLYPQHEWDPLKFSSKLPRGFWKDEKVQREALEALGKQLGVKELDDWYKVSATDVKTELSFIKNHYGSLMNALKRLYPEHNWDPLTLKDPLYIPRVPPNYWSDEKVQKEALENVGRQLGVKELDDWYNINATEVKNILSFIGNRYKGSLWIALRHFYPEHNWDPLKFSRAPRGYWKSEKTQREALEQLGKELGVKELNDWYSVHPTDVSKNLVAVKNNHKGPFIDVLNKFYPEHEWDPLRLQRIPRGYWNDEDAQRDALEKLGQELGVKELDDWYKVSAIEVTTVLSFIATHYEGSLCTALKHLYPHHNWDILRFARMPRGYWRSERSQKEAFDRLGKELGLKSLDDWYSIHPAEVSNYLGAVRNNHKGPFINLLKKLYPEHDWDPLRLQRIPRGYWNDESAQRDALDRVGRELGVKQLDDWHSVDELYAISKLYFIETRYEGSLLSALKRLYPQHDWNPLKFSKLPRGFWRDENEQRKALERFGREIGVKELDDWYNVSPTEIFHHLKFIRVFHKGPFVNMLMKLYPHHNWDPLRFQKTPYKYWSHPSTMEYHRNLFKKWQKEYNIHTARDWFELPPQQLLLFKRAAKGMFSSVIKLLENWFPETVAFNDIFYTSQLELQMMLKHVVSDVLTNRRQIENRFKTFIPDWNTAMERNGVHYLYYSKRNKQNADSEREQRLSQLNGDADSLCSVEKIP